MSGIADEDLSIAGSLIVDVDIDILEPTYIYMHTHDTQQINLSNYWII